MTIRDELRQWGLRKTFVHQFKLIAQRVIPKLKLQKRREGESFRYPWRRYTSYKNTPQPKPGLAAVKHEQRSEEQQDEPEPLRPNAHQGSHSVNHRSFFPFTFR
jgi:hypothetical protein